MSGQGTRALRLLAGAGIAHRVREYSPPVRTGRERDARPTYGLEAAEALRVPPGTVFKTLVVAVDDGLALAVVPVERELDLKALAAAVGGRRAGLATPEAAERATGYVIGGISPLGGRRALPTVVDAAAMAHPAILVSAGRRGLQVELAPADLVRLTSAQVAQISRPNVPPTLVRET
jgi:Cys-tRNA(Pro)/Cys-tRNA(Cys) deacylase